MNKQPRKADHGEVPPLIDKKCTCLVLGSMLSPKSADAKFYYAHPQNRFWNVLAAVFGMSAPKTQADKTTLALSNGIALWDVIESCNILGAADSTITDVVYNDIAGMLALYPNIERIFTTGTKAHELLIKYNKTAKNALISAAVRLPSTSPLNCAFSFAALVEAYSALAK